MNSFLCFVNLIGDVIKLYFKKGGHCYFYLKNIENVWNTKLLIYIRGVIFDTTKKKGGVDKKWASLELDSIWLY